MTPKNGHMICNTDDFSFNTECRFTCDTGYKLVGSRKRMCLAIAFWTGINTRCRGESFTIRYCFANVGLSVCRWAKWFPVIVLRAIIFHMLIGHGEDITPIEYVFNRSKVKVTLLLNRFGILS